MFTANERILQRVGALESSNLPIGPGHSTLRWVNFNVCPHCVALNRPWLIERLTENGPVISRSDGVNFHLVLGDRPIEYPAERASGKSDMLSAGFWYLHQRNGGLTETVVVVLRRPAKGGVPLLRLLNTVADVLFDQLVKSPLLERAYEFYGQRLHRFS